MHTLLAQGVVVAACVPSSPLFVSGCMDGVVRLWDSRTAGCEKELKGHRDSIQSLVISPDGRRVLSGADDHAARIFEL